MISRFALAHVGVQVNVLLNNCKQNISSLSLLVGHDNSASCFDGIVVTFNDTKLHWLLTGISHAGSSS